MKTPERRQASSGVVSEQMVLFERPLFSPIYPKRTTLAGRALALLLQGRSINTVPTATAQTGKFVAVLAYCDGAASLRETAAKFARHPSWRHA